jgi:hypothetical protein
MTNSNTTTFSDTTTKKTADLRFKKKNNLSEEFVCVTYDAILDAKTKLEKQQEEIIHFFKSKLWYLLDIWYLAVV